MNEFAAAIAEISTKDLAQLCGVSMQAVQAWKRGDSVPDYPHLPKIARRAGWPLGKLAEAVIRDASAKRSKPA